MLFAYIPKRFSGNAFRRDLTSLTPHCCTIHRFEESGSRISLLLSDCWLPLSAAQRHPLCDCASTILFLLLYSFVNVYYLSLVSAKNAEGMKRIQAGGEVRSTEPLLRVRKQISAEGTTESLSPPWGFTHSFLPCRGFATLHHLPMFCRPFQDLSSPA